MTKFVKVNVEVLNKLIEHFDKREVWLMERGNDVAAQYYAGLAELLRRVRNGDFS